MGPVDIQIEDRDGQPFTFRIAYLDGVTGFKLSSTVMRLFGATAARALAGGTSAAAGAVLGAGLSVDELEGLAKTLGAVSQVNPTPNATENRWLILDEKNRKTFFAGRQRMQFAWIGEALQVQLADFFASKKSDAGD